MVGGRRALEPRLLHGALALAVDLSAHVAHPRLAEPLLGVRKDREGRDVQTERAKRILFLCSSSCLWYKQQHDHPRFLLPNLIRRAAARPRWARVQRRRAVL